MISNSMCARCGNRFVPWGWIRNVCEPCKAALGCPPSGLCDRCPGGVTCMMTKQVEAAPESHEAPRPTPNIPPPPALGKREHAVVWLAGQLANGPVACLEVGRRAKAANISQKTLRRAKKVIDVRSVRVGGLAESGFWGWILPPGGGIVEAKMALRISAPPLFTRRVVGLTVAALLPYRPYWTPRPGGFEVTLSGTHQYGARWSQVLQLVSSACSFGGSRHFLVCQRCRHRAMALYQTGDLFARRRCAGLRYVSANWTDHIRLGHHYGNLKAQLACRPGRKPPRFGRYEFYELLHWHLGLRGILSWADRVDARKAKREERARAAAIAWLKRIPSRGKHNPPARRAG
jgi:hypothetical protein